MLISSANTIICFLTQSHYKHSEKQSKSNSFYCFSLNNLNPENDHCKLAIHREKSFDWWQLQFGTIKVVVAYHLWESLLKE